jgi:glycosyltransferase involved in cell wall biosynthesis
VQAATDPGPVVSVIVPTYNRAETLPRALTSILEQTRPPRHIIVVDDGSTDTTAELVKQRFPQAHYLYQPNAGVSAARNAGIRFNERLADPGEWIALLDSDDAWLPDKLEQQLEAWQRQPHHRLIHCDEIWIRNGRRVNPRKKHRKYGGHIFQHCLPLCAISPSAVLLHRALLDDTGLFDEGLPACEDYDLWLRVSHREAVLLVDAPLLIKYGGHADQLSRQHWGMDRFRVRALCRCIEHEELAPEQRRAALAVLGEKLDILIMGARKRGNETMIRDYEALKQRFLDPGYT